MRPMALLTLITAAAALCLASCTGKQTQTESSTVRIFRTPTVQQATEAPEGLRAMVVWPAEQDLDQEQIAALADPLIDLDPPWGSYVGIAQAAMESDAGTTRENHLEVALTSLDSIDPLKTFCEQHYPNSVALIHCDADLIWVEGADQIIRDYGEAGGG